MFPATEPKPIHSDVMEPPEHHVLMLLLLCYGNLWVLVLWEQMVKEEGQGIQVSHTPKTAPLS